MTERVGIIRSVPTKLRVNRKKKAFSSVVLEELEIPLYVTFISFPYKPSIALGKLSSCQLNEFDGTSNRD